MATGTVKFFNDQKGYGFISREDGEDLFVHFSNIVGSGRRTLVQGQKVNFEIGEGRRGPEARNVEAV
jgi:CspA family cold shock protein